MRSVRRGVRRSPFAAPRPRPLRRAAGVVAGVALVAVLATAWLDRSEVRRLELGTPARVTVANRAGPVEVVERDGPVVIELAQSYLATGPEVALAADGDRAAVEVSCPGWGPCRVALVVSVPPGTAVQASAPGHPLSAGAFSGALTVAAADGPVSLGPVSGPLRVTAGSGAVRAADLRSREVEIRAGSAPVELTFGRLPGEVAILADSGPVELTLPATVYRLDLRGGPLDDGGLEPAASARRAVTVHSGGPVTVTTVPVDR